MTSPPDLDARLADLATALDAPTGERVAAAVLARLRTGDAVVGSAGRRPAPVSRGARRWAVVAAAVAVAIAGAVAAPAVADWFGVRGIEIRPSERSTPTTKHAPAPIGARLDLGTAVPSLAAAEEAAGFAPVVPHALGSPDAIWVDRRGAAPFISLAYDDGPLLIEFDATVADDAVISKMASPDTRVEQLRIHGEPAVWIDGIHDVAVRARDGSYVFERLRLSDKVLLVQHGSLTIRIETAPGKGRDDAVRIAESLPR